MLLGHLKIKQKITQQQKMFSRAIMNNLFDTKKTKLENYSEIKTKVVSTIFQLGKKAKKKVLHSIYGL